MTAITKIIHDHLIRFYFIWVTGILYHSKVLNSLITFYNLKEYAKYYSTATSRVADAVQGV